LGHRLEAVTIKVADGLYMNAVSGKNFPVVVSLTAFTTSEIARSLSPKVVISNRYLADLDDPENREAQALL
jgi:hypothetical protein